MTVEDNGDVYLVPAFSGLFAPYWRPDARGVVTGLTRYATKGHLARAALEASAYQTKDVLDAMAIDSGVELAELRVDGGMTANKLLMQFQADILGVDVVLPRSRRPPRSERPLAQGSQLGSGVTAMSSLRCGPRPRGGLRPCRRKSASGCTPGGKRRWNAHSGGLERGFAGLSP